MDSDIRRDGAHRGAALLGLLIPISVLVVYGAAYIALFQVAPLLVIILLCLHVISAGAVIGYGLMRNRQRDREKALAAASAAPLEPANPSTGDDTIDLTEDEHIAPVVPLPGRDAATQRTMTANRGY